MNNSSELNNTLQCPAVRLSVTVQWLQTIVYLAIVLVALVGNIMIIRVVFAHQRMRTPTNYLIVNIAVGDLLMVFLFMIPTVVSMLLNSPRWIDGLAGEILCKLIAFTPNVSISCSIFSMTALAFERFLAVVFPMKRLVNKSNTIKLIIAVWLASLCSNAPLLYAFKVVIYEGVPYCTEDWSPAFDRATAPAVFTVTSFVIQYALPLLIICPLYYIIITKVWRRQIPGNITAANARLARRSKMNVLKMLVATVLAFAACWLVTYVNYFLIYFSHVFYPCGIPWELQLAGFLLGYSNTAINCCIYVTFSDDYRRGFKKILRPLFRRQSQSLSLEKSQRPSTEEGNSTSRASGRVSVGMTFQTARPEDLGQEFETVL